MISLLSRITIPADASPETVNLCQQFNSHLAELELQLALLQGADGQQAFLSSPLDLQNNRVTNIASPRQNSDAATQRTLKQKSAFRMTKSQSLKIQNVRIKGLKIPNARTVRQPVTLSQVATGTAGSVTSVVGTTDEITATEIAGTVTLSGGGTDGITTDVIVAMEAAGGGAIGIRYKTRSVTLHNGIVTMGAESAWVNL